MTDKRIMVIMMAAAMVIAICGVVYYYRRAIKKAVEQPKETLLYLAQEWENFISNDSTLRAIKALCRLADKVVLGEGSDRLAFVCGRLYELVPDYLQTVITIEKLKEIVNLVYEEIKVKLEDGSYVAGEE